MSVALGVVQMAMSDLVEENVARAMRLVRAWLTAPSSGNAIAIVRLPA